MESVTEDNGADDATPPAAVATAEGVLAGLSLAEQQRLAAFLMQNAGQPAMQQRAQQAGLYLTDPRALPPLAPEPPPDVETFAVSLPPRFAMYVRSRAAAHGQTESDHLATMIRWFWQHDLWRQQPTAPTGPGQPAGTSRRT